MTGGHRRRSRRRLGLGHPSPGKGGGGDGGEVVDLPVQDPDLTLRAEGALGDHVYDGDRSRTGHRREAVSAVPVSVPAHDHLRLVARAIPVEGIDLGSPQSTARTPSSLPPATAFCARRLLPSVLPLLFGEVELPSSLHA
jgi:hypothetical protein